mmetsp:Transcript_27076/g.76047  ORF Transcript_27076/g.76047 Transcript_27076/m.76047 type:complete len:167 (+) Transcript_27076:30-530(+)
MAHRLAPAGAPAWVTGQVGAAADGYAGRRRSGSLANLQHSNAVSEVINAALMRSTSCCSRGSGGFADSQLQRLGSRAISSPASRRSSGSGSSGSGRCAAADVVPKPCPVPQGMVCLLQGGWRDVGYWRAPIHKDFTEAFDRHMRRATEVALAAEAKRPKRGRTPPR